MNALPDKDSDIFDAVLRRLPMWSDTAKFILLSRCFKKNSVLQYGARARYRKKWLEQRRHSCHTELAVRAHRHRIVLPIYEESIMPIGTLFLGSTGKDVELLQQALFEKKFYKGLIDGAFDAATEQAVIAFQNSAGLKPDGVAGPVTLRALGLLGDDAAADPVTRLSVELVSEMCVGAPLQNIRTHLPNINRALIARGLQAPPTVLMAIATIHVESGQFKPIPEGISKFNTELPDGPPFAKYNSRHDLGNGPHDGATFRGRGFVQLTGRANYQLYGPLLTPPIKLEDVPDRALESAIAADLLCLYLKKNSSRIGTVLTNDVMAPTDKLVALRKIVNGGTHGIEGFMTAWKKGAGLMGLSLADSLKAGARQPA